MSKILLSIFMMLFTLEMVYADKYDELVYGDIQYKYIDNSSYTGTSLNISSKEYRLLSNSNVTIVFSEGRIFGSSEVNRYIGTYELETGKIKIRVYGSTMMMGAEKDMEQEQEFLKWIAKSHRIKLSKDKLFIGDKEFVQIKSIE